MDGESWFNPLEMWDYGAGEKHIIPADDVPYSETSEYEEYEYESDDSEDEEEKSMATRSMEKTSSIDEVARSIMSFLRIKCRVQGE